MCTKVMRGAECSTDHYLVRCQIRHKITAPRRTTNGTTPKKLDLGKLANEEHCRRLAETVSSAVNGAKVKTVGSEDIEEQWQALKKAVYFAAEMTLGHPQR